MSRLTKLAKQRAFRHAIKARRLAERNVREWRRARVVGTQIERMQQRESRKSQ